MKRIAFYAPVKPPDHPIPSGDREISRLLVKAMERAGHDVTLASRFITYQKRPGRELFETRMGGAEAETGRLVAAYKAMSDELRPQIWFTYHTYCKAPDTIGPVVAKAFGIPYVTAEACRTRQNTDADWQAGREIVQGAIRQAAINFCLKPSDREYLETVLPAMNTVINLPPFVDEELITANSKPKAVLPFANNDPVIVTTGMMRPGKKFLCYEYLAKALKKLPDHRWNLVLIGDGPEREKIEYLFSGLPQDRLYWAGLVAPEAVHGLMAAASIFAWPGYQEPIGMVYLEAQTLALPVVAMASLGVPTVVGDEETGLLSAEGDVVAYAANLERLLKDENLRARLGKAGPGRIHQRNGIQAASTMLSNHLEQL